MNPENAPTNEEVLELCMIRPDKIAEQMLNKCSFDEYLGLVVEGMKSLDSRMRFPSMERFEAMIQARIPVSNKPPPPVQKHEVGSDPNKPMVYRWMEPSSKGEE